MKVENIFLAVIYITGAVMVISGIVGVQLSESEDTFFLVGACAGLILMILVVMIQKINEIIINTNATTNAE